MNRDENSQCAGSEFSDWRRNYHDRRPRFRRVAAVGCGEEKGVSVCVGAESGIEK